MNQETIRRIRFNNKFKKDLRKADKQGKDLNKLVKVLEILKKGLSLPEIYDEHYLKGEYLGCLECHISSDWILIYKVFPKDNLLILERLGTHNELFNY